MNSVMQTEKLCKWYGNILGVSDIQLQVNSGIHGLLGPNGAGKSTFLKLATGQLKPSMGWIRIFDQEVFDNPSLFRRVGFCPEYDSFFSEMSGREFILFTARLHGFSSPEADQKAKKALEQVGLLDPQERLVKTYSFGMRQRLRFAASIVHEPDLLLLDEPLRGIDPLWRIRLINWIKAYEKTGKTIIISSHILPEIEAMTNSIILIHQGKIFAEGDISYIRNLIDSHPHQISIRLSDPRPLAERMIRQEFIREVRFDSESATVVFHTGNRDSFYSSLMQVIVDGGFDIEEIISPDDNLQAVFDYLIGR